MAIVNNKITRLIMRNGIAIMLFTENQLIPFVNSLIMRLFLKLVN